VGGVEPALGRARHRGRAGARYPGADPRWSSGPEGLLRTPWWHALGPTYVDQAFRLAHAADPQAALFVNDDWLEYPQCREKRAIYLRLLEAWVKRGVPIHGFGIEAHLRPEHPFDAKPYRAFLADIASLGLIIHVTELDVIDRDLPADIATRDRIVADTAARFLDQGGAHLGARRSVQRSRPVRRIAPAGRAAHPRRAAGQRFPAKAVLARAGPRIRSCAPTDSLNGGPRESRTG
jgi:hypothetical protein